MKNTHQSLFDAIYRLEEKGNCTKIQYYGIHIWPIIRILFSFEQIIRDYKSYDTKPLKSKKLPRDVNSDNLREIGDQIVSIVFSHPNYQIPLGDHKVDRIMCNVLHECIDSGQEIIEFNTIGNNDHSDTKYYFNYTYIMKKFLMVLSLIASFVSFISFFNINKIIYSLLKNTDLNLFEKSKFILRTNAITHYIIFMSIYFYNVLKSVKSIKTMYTANFYSAESMALTIACKRLGVYTINMQHGNQSVVHPAFGDWKSMPLQGYEIIPSIFYCWDDISAASILAWNNHNHITKVVGHPLAKYKQYYFDYTSNTKNNKCKIILVTLHPRIGLAPQVILEAIRMSLKIDWSWIIRMHPRQKGEDVLKLYRECSDNIIVHSPDEINLYESLLKCDIHITGFSSCVLEAEHFNVETIFIDKLAASYYPDLIDNGNSVICESAEELYKRLTITLN
jgi:hypothetical protein